MAQEQIQEISPDGAQATAKKGPLVKIVIIGFLAALVTGGAGYFFYGKTLMGRYQHRGVQRAEVKREIGPILAFEPFIINVSGNTSRFVKISVAMELGNEKAVERARKMIPVIRDMMLSVLGPKTPEVFLDINGRSAMKKELFDGARTLLKGSDLKAVYITDIVMQ
jgi:flagellar FliL protein